MPEALLEFNQRLAAHPLSHGLSGLNQLYQCPSVGQCPSVERCHGAGSESDLSLPSTRYDRSRLSKKMELPDSMVYSNQREFNAADSTHNLRKNRNLHGIRSHAKSQCTAPLRGLSCARPASDAPPQKTTSALRRAVHGLRVDSQPAVRAKSRPVNTKAAPNRVARTLRESERTGRRRKPDAGSQRTRVIRGTMKPRDVRLRRSGLSMSACDGKGRDAHVPARFAGRDSMRRTYTTTPSRVDSSPASGA
ncbi:hypothetical protein C8R43DRAFT_487402 [Mycena crocata]|nr:hypothetical protein C8R43DRAFT_487402 [Mycena crocata]